LFAWVTVNVAATLKTSSVVVGVAWPAVCVTVGFPVPGVSVPPKT
jgi:hypothetical protein